MSTFIAVTATFIGLILYFAYSRHSFNQNVRKITADIDRDCTGGAIKLYSKQDLKSLPEPVQRYFKFALPEEPKNIKAVHLKQIGQFRTSDLQKWRAMEAEEYISGSKPAFVWSAVIRQKSWLPINVRDMYHRGKGAMLIKIRAAVPVANVRGSKTDIAMLAKYLTECVWLPTALFAGFVEWQAVDADTARAIIRDNGNVASAEVTFDQSGRIVKMTTIDRYREVNGQINQEKWTARYFDYREINGFKIPFRIEADWNLTDGDFHHSTVEVVDVIYRG